MHSNKISDTEGLFVSNKERIARLRERCLERKNQSCPDRTIVDYESFKHSENVDSLQLRIGMRTRDRLVNVKFAIDDLELLMGRFVPSNSDQNKHEQAVTYLAQFPCVSGQNGHCELDRSRIFNVGIDGLVEEITVRGKETADEKTKNVYQSFLYALEGFSLFIEHAAHTVEKQIKQALPARKDELLRLADACARIAHKPPTSFFEALQLLWFMDIAVTCADNAGLVGPGHIDRTLRRFYENDLRNGKITRDEALLLIESLYLLINEFISDGLAIPVMVGGRDEHGNDLTNDLSYLCLEALRRVRLVYPTVGVCWHENTPQDLVDLAVELISQGYPQPAFFGDETIQRGLTGYGVSHSEACNYINSTCVEITPVGSSNVWVASPYFNTCRILLEEIEAEIQGHSTTTDFAGFFTCVVSPETVHACLSNSRVAASFPEFLERYQRLLAVFIHAAVQDVRRVRQDRRQWGGKPLQSVFTNDCISRGRDIDDGGARYNWIECSFVGLANLADALHVIKNEIYIKKTMDFKNLKTVLDANYVGHEAERLRFLQGYEKYGNDAAEVDSLFKMMIVFVDEECRKHRVLPDEAYFIPGAFCWVMHERLGRECGATPDGRKAGTPFADGCGPAQGREKNGPTSAIKSTTSWDHAPMIGGLAYNMKFNTTLFKNDRGKERLRDLVLTFLRRGGFETQINVVDNETLKKAKANPDQYRDLAVRIGGYTDYFTKLSPEMQDEVMQRTGFEVF
ncbi:MAG: hypothetical protein L6437_03060 [Kiritimatiellae bacterium]|nr:hypothetical protein [Kiritimatiellia bacterium]